MSRISLPTIGAVAIPTSRNRHFPGILNSPRCFDVLPPCTAARQVRRRNPAVTAAIVGVRRADQVAGVIGAGEWALTDAEAGEINAFLQTTPVAR